MRAEDSQINYMAEANEFLQLCQLKTVTLDSLCQAIALIPVTVYPPKGVSVFQLNLESTYSIVSTYGYPNPNIFKAEWQDIPLFIRTPMSDVLRTKQLLFIATKEELLSKYEIPQDDRLSDYRSNILVLPIIKSGLVIGALTIAGLHEKPTNEVINFYQLIATMVGRRVKDRCHTTLEIAVASKKSLIGISLTKRESMIQAMMGDGKINSEIANELGYSESTIRQDAVSMFSKLGVSNRKEAGQLAKK